MDVHGVGVQLGRMRNLPAFDNGIMILEQLQQMQQMQQQQQQQQMLQQQQQLTRLETAVAGIAEKSDVTERNAIARVENNHVLRGDHELVLPYSFGTGATVVDCPNTANEIMHLGSEQINQVLRQLRLPTSGRVADRTRRLLRYMGVTVQAI